MADQEGATPDGGTPPGPDPAAAEPTRTDDSAAGGQSTPPADPSSKDDADDEVNEDRIRNDQRTVIKIAKFQAEVAAFGTDSSHRRGAVGAITAAVIAETLGAFCSSESFQEAEERLAKHRMVVLLGSEGSGRYHSSLALLGGWPRLALDNPVVSFSPTTTIAELAAKDRLKSGRRYLLHDARGDGRANAELRFELARLRQALADTEARLVITASAGTLFRGDFGELVVEWRPAAAAEVFDSHYAHRKLALDADELARAKAHAATLVTPAEVAAFAARLIDGVEKAMHSQVDADRDRVRTWFDDEGKTLEAEFAVAAACFLDRVPERMFERCLGRLRQLILDFDIEERASVTTPIKLTKAWAIKDGLLTTIEPDDPFADPLVAFRSPHMRRPAIEEVWRRYGDNLLNPLRRWIHELSRDVALEVRAQAAAGLALLGEIRWNEVMDSFVEPWSKDLAINRAAAATTLSMMATSDKLAPRALEVALKWSEKHGPRRGRTAALALGGPLNERYPDRTFEQLWYLASVNNPVAAVARVSLSLTLTGAHEDGDLDRVVLTLKNVRDALRWAKTRRSALELRCDVSTVLTVLVAPSDSVDGLVVADLLRRRSQAAGLVGELLGEVLHSAPHRHRGVDILRRVLAELTSAPGGAAAAAQLGNAVFGTASAELREPFRQTIKSELSVDAANAELSRQIIRSFIHGLTDN